MDCLFCAIAAGEIPADIVYEDSDVIAFRDISPQAPCHLLVIPKQHISTLNDAEPEHQALLGKLLYTGSQLAAEQGLAEQGYRLVMNCNSDGGQTVFHIHLHVLGGRAMTWPPG